MQFISTALDRTEKPDVAGSSSLQMSAGSGLSLEDLMRPRRRGIEANSNPLCRQFTRNSEFSPLQRDAQETDDIAGKSTSHFNEQEDYSSLVLVIIAHMTCSPFMCLYMH